MSGCALVLPDKNFFMALMVGKLGVRKWMEAGPLSADRREESRKQPKEGSTTTPIRTSNSSEKKKGYEQQEWQFLVRNGDEDIVVDDGGEANTKSCSRVNASSVRKRDPHADSCSLHSHSSLKARLFTTKTFHRRNMPMA
jgi:hypothetical protein